MYLDIIIHIKNKNTSFLCDYKSQICIRLKDPSSLKVGSPSKI